EVNEAKDWVDVMLGKSDPFSLLSAGRAAIVGETALAMKLGEIFAKYQPPKIEFTTKDFILDMFGTLVGRFQPQNAQGLDASITYQIGGEGGGVWTATIKDGKCTLKEGHVDKATVKLEVNEAKDWVDVMLGKSDPFSLLSAGRAAIVGRRDRAGHEARRDLRQVPAARVARRGARTGAHRVEENNIGQTAIRDRAGDRQISQCDEGKEAYR
ncbi:MAG: SCP2 sterol-binding domain-containing protein, partial [Spirochaetes bacterium]|nr:SCP2 sterol-binding domain-containing protein [Spirochaetota bacterium]